MGQYTLASYKVHGHPLYVKIDPESTLDSYRKKDYPYTLFFLYRSSSTLRWLVTSDELKIGKNVGIISSCQAANIPTELRELPSPNNIGNIFGLLKKRGPLTWCYTEWGPREHEDKSIVLKSTRSTPLTGDFGSTVILSTFVVV